ncbi:MAG TPA: tetratricopeptide repeat protein [Trichocoleus sp.]
MASISDSINPESADPLSSVKTLNASGCTLCETGQFEAAVRVFDDAIALAPNHCTTWNNRANALSGLNRYAEALSAYDKAVALNPTYHQAWFNRGQLLREMGAYGNALASYQQAINLADDPRYIHARETIWVKGHLFTDQRIV